MARGTWMMDAKGFPRAAEEFTFCEIAYHSFAIFKLACYVANLAFFEGAASRPNILDSAFRVTRVSACTRA